MTDNLTEKQEKFVENFMSGMKPKDAAENAGYSEATVRNVRQNIIESDSVKKELNSRSGGNIFLSRIRLLNLSPKAIDKIESVLEDPSASPKTQLRAAETILNRSDELKEKMGIDVVGEISGKLEITEADRELKDRIDNLKNETSDN